MPLTRREFLKVTGVAAAGSVLAGCAAQAGEELAAQPAATQAPATRAPDTQAPSPTDPPRPDPTAANAAPGAPPAEPPAATATPQPSPTAVTPPHLVVMHGRDPAAITRAAVAALGGIERFVSSGQDVVIKPNICVAYHTPEYAATTNPEVVAELVRLSLAAGAKRVRVMDQPFGGTAATAYRRSGIAAAVEAAGGAMEVMSPLKFAKFDIPDGRDITSWEFYRDILEADVVINVPIAKHHSLARLTLGGKNMMGTVTNPNKIHRNLHQRIADLVSRVRPALTVIDAVRILTANGPTGGDLKDVKQMDTVIASADIVAADAYAATLFGLTGSDIGYIQACHDMGLGTMDLSSIQIAEAAI